MHLHNCCFRGKTIRITYSECVFVDLVIQNAVHMRPMVICGLSVYSIFPHYLINATIFKKYYMVLTLNLCVVCGPQNKQRLLTYTALIDWFGIIEVWKRDVRLICKWGAEFFKVLKVSLCDRRFWCYLLSVLHNNMIKVKICTINEATCFNPLGSSSGL